MVRVGLGCLTPGGPVCRDDAAEGVHPPIISQDPLVHAGRAGRMATIVAVPFGDEHA